MAEVKEYTITGSGFSQEDLQGVVRVHRAELSEGFLSSLGDGALGILFDHAATSRFAVLLVAKKRDSGEVIGFLLGTTNTSRFYEDFLKRYSLKALLIVGPKLFSLKRLYKVAETLLYPSRDAVKDLPPAELLDIAVGKSSQGLGIGQELFHAFCDRLRKQQIGEFRITTGESLAQAHRFYERLGATRASNIEVHKGQKTFVYLYSLGRAPGDNQPTLN